MLKNDTEMQYYCLALAGLHIVFLSSIQSHDPYTSFLHFDHFSFLASHTAAAASKYFNILGHAEE